MGLTDVDSEEEEEEGEAPAAAPRPAPRPKAGFAFKFPAAKARPRAAEAEAGGGALPAYLPSKTTALYEHMRSTGSGGAAAAPSRVAMVARLRDTGAARVDGLGGVAQGKAEELGEVRGQLGQALARLLEDEARNAAYEHAIGAAVARARQVPGLRCAVLVWGVGTGLPALLAARAGAGVVVVAEDAPALRDYQTRLLDSNGLEAAVVSRQEVAEALENTRCDAFVTEAVGTGLLDEGCLMNCQMAVQSYLSPGGALIPHGADVYAQAVSAHTGTLSGFDLSLFNAFRQPPETTGYSPVRHGRAHAETVSLSEPARVFRLDFAQPRQPRQKEDERTSVRVLRDGTCNGVVFWFELHMFPGQPPFSTAPERNDCGLRAYRQALHQLGVDVPLRAGDDCELRAEHDQIKFRFHVNGRPGLGEMRPETGVLPWHFPMIADEGRNGAFQAAIERHVSSGTGVVLDIGAGTGLLAMMCARAGARRVVSCEMVPSLARCARRICEANGCSGQVTVVNALSTDMSVGRDLPERAHVVVSEILDHAILGEGVLPTFEHAQHELAVPGAVLIPSGATMRAQLLDCRIRDVQSLNMRAFNGFYCSGAYDSWLSNPAYRPLSDPFDAVSFDFYRPHEGLNGGDVTVQLRCQEAGVATSVGVWFRMTLTEGIVYDSGPSNTTPIQAWKQLLFHLPVELPVEKGDTVAVRCVHDGERFLFSLGESHAKGVLHRKLSPETLTTP